MNNIVIGLSDQSIMQDYERLRERKDHIAVYRYPYDQSSTVLPHTTNNREGLYIATTARILCAEYFDHLCMISCHGIACERTIFHLVLLIRLTQV